MCRRREQKGILWVRKGPEGPMCPVLRGHIYTLSALGGLETQALGDPRGS